jgi:hypothetical protein
MADSTLPGSTGKHYPAASPRTGGPLGTKSDSADTSTPSWFLGDTKGPLGHNDHADPDARMCSMDAYRYRIWLNDYLKVKAELEETYRIRDAFADEKLLKEAREKGWASGEYTNAIKKRLFGGAEQGKDYDNPMYTDPWRGSECKIVENWSAYTYMLKGFPSVFHAADRAHEESHLASCKKDKNPLTYAADMSDPAKLSQDETKAYSVKIAVLEKWLKDNPPPISGPMIRWKSMIDKMGAEEKPASSKTLTMPPLR